ncbi:ribosomal large subunit pseudouridine synthase C [Spiroplasma corruscae]|uniref:RNA pseudouridylate synthase n=1 Tax=Spiroplasma corruscae TaxID=216934 RepID=A0A222EN27_9MOLU|nr:RluA family pseudouridine synthase [Spiroplasma corruscae]ASP27878.1 ribosomal large subunit pseudouridine synthase C [Spiroplasma corruscae]
MAKFTATSNDTGQTLVKFVKKVYRNTNLSIIYKWFRKGKIKVNYKKQKDLKYIISENDFIEVFDSELPIDRNKFNLVDFSSLKILYEDENILVTDKEQGLEVHSPVKVSLDSMVRSYLISSNKFIPDNENSYVISHVHRIDKLTKGIVIYAKNKATHSSLIEAIKDKEKIKKYYLVWAENSLAPIGNIKGQLNYSDLDKRMFFSQDKKTKDRTKQVEQIHELISEKNNIYRVQILTGRKHQIRAVFSYFKCPIVNDNKYKAKKQYHGTFGLIASCIEFLNFDDHLSYLNGLIIQSNYNFNDKINNNIGG